MLLCFVFVCSGVACFGHTVGKFVKIPNPAVTGFTWIPVQTICPSSAMGDSALHLYGAMDIPTTHEEFGFCPDQLLVPVVDYRYR